MPWLLRIHTADAKDDPYVLDYPDAMREAIEAEAQIIADDAGSDLLASPDDAARAELRSRIYREATLALSLNGEYRDPVGVRWTVEHTAEQED